MNHSLLTAPSSLHPDDLHLIFDRITRLKVGVIGDFALDVYFDYATQTGEESLETALPVHWGHQPRASLGAAGNVVQNLLALGVGQVWAIGCVGPDLFGREMRHLFGQQGVCTDHLLTANEGWDTCVYTKPMEGQIESNRIDFGNRNHLSDSLFAQLIDALNSLLPQLDVLIINQQFGRPLLTPDRIEPLNNLIRQHPSVQFVADLRDSGLLMRGVTVKVNTAELARFLHLDAPENPDLNWCLEYGATLSRQLAGPVVVTRGKAGIACVGAEGVWSVEGLALPGPLDTVGAGDTVVATLAATLPAGANWPQSLAVANLAAAVTVQKLGQTGTATPLEIGQLLTSYPLSV